MTKYLTLIFKNLLRSKRRNILTILSIAVSLFIFSVLVSLPTFANQMLADTTSSVRIICRTKMGLAYPLPVSYKPKIAAIPHVIAVAPLVIYGGIYHEVSDQFPSVATEAAQIDMWSDWGLTGVDEFKKIKTACLVAQGTMRRFNLHVGQQIQLRGTVYPFNVTLTIVGTIDKGPVPSFLIFRLDYFEEAAGNPGIAHEFWVRVDDSRVVPEVCAALDKQFANCRCFRSGNWQHSGSLPYFYETGRVCRPGGRRGNWAGRGEHGGDVHSRASQRNRGNALDRISLGGDLESACGRIVDCCFIGRSDWLRGGVWTVQGFRVQR